MSGMTPYLANAILEHILRGDVSGTGFTQPTEIYVALHTASPVNGSESTGELSGGGYGRQLILFDSASGGSIANSNSVEIIIGESGTVSHFSLWDASTDGNCLFWDGIATPLELNGGDTYSIQPGALVLNRLDG